MKKDPLEVKLDKYYKELQNPKRIIGRWAIIDDNLLNKLNKTKLEHINDMYSNKNETIIVAENKKNYIIIKHNYMFIAVKLIVSEYESLMEDWSLIAINKNYLYGKEDQKSDTSEQIMKLLGFKLSKKAMIDFEYFGSI